MNTLFDLDEPDTRTEAEIDQQCRDLTAELRRAGDGISHLRCIEVAGPKWLELLRERGVAVMMESCGLVRIEN